MTDILINYTDVNIKNAGHTVFSNLNLTIKNGEQWAFTGSATGGIPLLMEALAGKTHLIGKNVVTPPSAVLVSNTSHFKNRSNTGDFYFQQRFNSSESGDAKTVLEYLNDTERFSSNARWTIENTLQRLQLHHLADKPIILLSNGETRRLLLAEALIKSPILLLLDNPMAGLDTATRADLNLLISEVVASGIQVVVAVAPNEIPDAATHIAVFDDAKLIAQVSAPDFNPELYNFTTDSSFDHQLLSMLIANWQPPAFKNIIDMQGVTIRYGEKTILNTIEWQVKPGECWLIKGHNGSGKSTLLSLVSGDNPQSYANNLWLFDRKRGTGESIWDIKKNIGFASADLPKFFPKDQSCSQIIESGLYDTMGLFRKPKEENTQTIQQWLKLFKIEAYANKNFAAAPLSIQRLCLIVRAVIKNPPLLILDEPGQGLDNSQVSLLKDIISYICENTGSALLYVSHYDSEIPQCVTRTLTLQNGVVVN